MTTLVTEAPIWFIIFCLLLGAAYAFFLYRKDKQFKELPAWGIRLMAGFRFVSVFLISFLLLSPLVKSISRTVEKPVIIVAQDNSESIRLTSDSAFYNKQYTEQVDDLVDKLSENYTVNTYSFGEQLSKGIDFSYSEKLTDFSDLFNEIENRYINRNVGALILASDGIYNKGTNPLYRASDLGIPVYTLALGDTSIKKDIFISQVRSNRIAFLGNKTPVQVYVDIKDLNGESTNLSVFHNNKEIFSKTITATDASYSEIVNIDIEAKPKGLQRYTIRVSQHAEEVNTRNNSKTIVIDVIDSKQKILMLANSSHPDIGAIRKTLELNPNYGLQFSTIDKFKGNVNEYNLLILHQIPSSHPKSQQIVKQISNSEMPVLFIVGTQSAIRNFNRLKAGLKISQNKNNYEESQGILNQNFPLFEVNEEMKTFTSKAPPLITPFGEYQASGGASVLYYQRIKNIKTQKPLILLSPRNPATNSKIGIIAGEGIWRWRMYDFQQNNNNDAFNQVINKIIQYLSLNINKDNFVIQGKRIFNENENVTFEAEVYNESFELIQDAKVSMEIVNQEGKKFLFEFKPHKSGAKSYFLNAGTFPVGDYSYIAKAQIGEKQYLKEGRFTITKIDFESVNTTANHQVLYQLAEKTGGQMYFPKHMDELAEKIEANKDIVPISYSQKNLQDVVHFKWIFFLLLILLSVEWFLRKFWGGL